MTTTAGRRPTIRDVAERAEVSKSLVSLVMRGSDKVSPVRRQRVLDAAAELGYRPNAVARSLVLQRTNLIGVVISDIGNPFFAEYSEALQTAAEASGHRAVLASSGRDAARESDLADALLELRVEGLAIVGPVLGLAEMARLGAAGPTVVVSRHEASEAGLDTVVNDDAAGARLAVEHLAGLGHRRIAHITGGTGAGSPQRAEGFAAAMAACGLDTDGLVADGDFTESGGYAAARTLLAARPAPTALVAANDLSAVGALQAIDEAGLRVPEDLSLVGYDNTHLAALRQFSLTSVDQPRQRLADLTVAALLARVAAPTSAPRRRSVTPRLVVRASTASPPA